MNTAPLRWRERYMRNVTRMRSGQADQIQLVVNELTEREIRYGLSQGEKRMLKRASEMLGERGTNA